MGRKTIVAGCAVLAVALAGCGQTTSGQASAAFDDAKQLALAAKSETASVKSAKFDLQANMLGMQMSGQGAGRFDGKNSAAQMTMNMFGMQMEMRIIGGDMYLKMPSGMPGAKPTKPWVKMDNAQAAMGGAQMAEQNDPRKMLEMLERAGTITSSEQTEVNGTSATRYSIDLELAKLADELPGGISGKELDMVKKAGLSKIPMQVWIDEANRPARIQLDMSQMIGKLADSAGQQLPGEAKATVTMNYRDWGAPVNVQAPPADQVGEMPAPTGGMGGPGGSSPGGGLGGGGLGGGGLGSGGLGGGTGLPG